MRTGLYFPTNIQINILLLSGIVCLAACQNRGEAGAAVSAEEQRRLDSLEQIRIAEEAEKARPRVAGDITLTTELLYDQYTLGEIYDYGDTVREFQLEKIREKLAFIENFQGESGRYAVLQNYRNNNGEAPAVRNFHRNAYKRVSDSLGTEKYQSAPLYLPGKSDVPEIYGRDGFLVRLAGSDTIEMVRIEGISLQGQWDVPKRYLKTLADTVTFHRVVFVDVTNQNILTAERKAYCEWVVRSMNPATTGQHKPPYAQETPPGIFVFQEQKVKMFYTKDGTSTIEGYAPYASRFTNGAYVHGVPVNKPNGAIIEYSWTLGTTPRSHMCVRNASSHSRFIFDWIRPYQALAVVIE